jgi:hypothetical protein
MITGVLILQTLAQALVVIEREINKLAKVKYQIGSNHHRCAWQYSITAHNCIMRYSVSFHISR